MEDGQKWIEGIGSTFGFRYPMTEIPIAYWKCELACFKQDGDVIYLNPKFTDCETLTSIKNKESILYLSVFPNLLSKGKDLLIKSASGQIESIDIYNLLGSLIFSKSYKNHNDILINTMNFETGFYILKVVSENGFNTRKIIIK